MRVKGLVVALAVLAMVGVVASPASATLLIQGESTLFGAFAPTAFIRVDWQVWSPNDPAAPGGSTATFQYVYQIEATTLTNATGNFNEVGSMTITFTPPSVSFTSLGTVFGNLNIDSEVGADLLALGCCTAPSGDQLTAGTATWFFDPKIPHDGQSQLLIGFSPLPPILGDASALDGVPGSPWSTLSPGSERIPVPGRVPEPATVLLLGLGLVGIGSRAWMTRRK